MTFERWGALELKLLQTLTGLRNSNTHIQHLGSIESLPIPIVCQRLQQRFHTSSCSRCPALDLMYPPRCSCPTFQAHLTIGSLRHHAATEPS